MIKSGYLQSSFVKFDYVCIHTLNLDFDKYKWGFVVILEHICNEWCAKSVFPRDTINDIASDCIFHLDVQEGNVPTSLTTFTKQQH